MDIIKAVCGIFIGIFIGVILSLFEWFFGFILYHFKFSKIAGFKLMCVSGWFPKLLPKYCPCSSCYSTPCGMWTCPRFSEDNKKYTGLS